MTRLALFLVALVCLAAPAQAHRPPASGGPPPTGVVIPSLTHGQMAVIASNLSAIRTLAGNQIAGDMTLWRLEDYLSLQSFACLWGLVPGSIADEASPFNECAHAYLAAARAMLVHLRKMPNADHPAVEALIGRIETEMLMNDASLTLCRIQRRAVQHQHNRLAPLARNPVSSAKRAHDGGGPACAWRRGVDCPAETAPKTSAR